MSILSSLKERRLVAQCTDEPALQALLNEKKVCVYFGIDPTAGSIHVGTLLPLKVAMSLAQSGQQVIILLGGGTARIGDPSGKSQLRKMLSDQEITTNIRGIHTQLDELFARHRCEVRVVNNADWLLSLSYIDLLQRVGVHFSVNKMLSFETYRRRMESGLSFLEFNYQILQAFDYLHLCREFGCNLQIGGDDQWGNIVAGVDLIRRVERKEAYGLTMPLLTTATGQKMGKTEKGTIFLDKNRTSVFDFYQYWRNIPDEDLEYFLLLYTDIPSQEAKDFLAGGHVTVNQGKEYLAHFLTAFVHGQEMAEEARQAVQSLFTGSGDDRNIPSDILPYEKLKEGMPLVDLFFLSGLCASKSAARRLIQQGGARMNDLSIQAVDYRVEIPDIRNERIMLRAGKKKYFCFMMVK